MPTLLYVDRKPMILIHKCNSYTFPCNGQNKYGEKQSPPMYDGRVEAYVRHLKKSLTILGSKLCAKNPFLN